jgi:hypothetical protein
MLRDINDVKIGDKVIKDTLPIDGEMEVINILTSNPVPFVECKWLDKKNGPVKTGSFIPEELSLLITLDIKKYPHLTLLKQLFDEVFDGKNINHKKTNHISLHYFPEPKNYCFETVSFIEDWGDGPISVAQGYGGIGMLIHWLKTYYDEEITDFLGSKFFDGVRIRLQKENIGADTYSMEYWD